MKAKRTTIKRKGLVVVTNFGLQGLSPKAQYLEANSWIHGWCGFLNHKRTLIHIMHPDDKDCYIRMKLPCSLQGASENYLSTYLYDRMAGKYVV